MMLLRVVPWVAESACARISQALATRARKSSAKIARGTWWWLLWVAKLEAKVL